MSHFFYLAPAIALDLILGDPHWLPHPVRLMGISISRLEKIFRRICKSSASLKAAGVAILLLMVTFFGGGTYFLLKFLALLGPYYLFTGKVIISYYLLAGGCLAEEAKKVALALSNGLDDARRKISMLVGRDTATLMDGDIIRATVETVSENTVDGLVSPLFYLFIGGPVLAMVFKAVSTMDSMLGYMDEKYRQIGWAGAKTDDILNYIPARLTAFIMVLSAIILKLDYRNAFYILQRDHKNHKSPNCAWPEAAISGALNIRLGGMHMYFGKRVEKPYIGDDVNRPVVKNIYDTVKMMICSYIFSFMLFSFFEWSIGIIMG